MTFLKRLLGRRYGQFVYVCLLIVGALLNRLPRRFVFRLLVLSDAIDLDGRGRLYQAYFPYVTSYLTGHPEFRFTAQFSRSHKISVARVLHGIGAYREACNWIVANGLATASPSITFALVRSLFELSELEQAHEAASLLKEQDLASMPDLAFLKAMLSMISSDEATALESIDAACRGNAALLRPHQNIAARAQRAYLPNSLDLLCGSAGRLFDLCNFTGQRVTHVGRGEVGIRLFERALDAQAQLQSNAPPQLSAELKLLLDELQVTLGDLRLIPEEWSTQIGHLGMLDILFRMRDLGWWSGTPVIVARTELIANRAFFRLFESFAKVVFIGQTVSEQVGEELLSLQRWHGLNFNAFRLPDGRVVPWQDAGALAMEQWEQEGRGHPLRDVYDRIFDDDRSASEAFSRLRQQWGMRLDDWYVCLHTRDAAHYFEFSGTGQTHRNAPIEATFDAIRFITAQGGWVIKLGGPNSPILPKFERTVDYALSGARSDVMDLHLIRHARAFIGTTSGLTNVAVSFGVPSAIVNAITTDAQLWNSSVRFALKPIRDSDGTMITQRQLTSTPWRWRMFDAVVLRRSGGHPVNNAADEILGTVIEVEALASGRSAEFEADYDAAGLLSGWKGQLTVPHYYGASRPGLYYLKKYDQEFLACSERRA